MIFLLVGFARLAFTCFRYPGLAQLGLLILKLKDLDQNPVWLAMILFAYLE